MLSMEDDLLLCDFSFCLLVCLLLFYKLSNLLMIARYLMPCLEDDEEIIQDSSGQKTNTTEAKVSCESKIQLVG